MNAVTRTFSTIAAAGLLMGLGATASAKGVYDVRTPELPSRTISVSDLDLSSADGAEALYERIRAAARRVCIEEHDQWWIKASTMHRNRCIEKAVEQAVESANQPTLTAVHLGMSELLASR